MIEAKPTSEFQDLRDKNSALRTLRGMAVFAIEQRRNLDRIDEQLRQRLPLVAEAGMYFVVKPTNPRNALAVTITMQDSAPRQELYIAGGKCYDNKLEPGGPIRIDQDDTPIFVGTKVTMDESLPGRFVVVSANGNASTLYNPEMNMILYLEEGKIPG